MILCGFPSMTPLKCQGKKKVSLRKSLKTQELGTQSIFRRRDKLSIKERRQLKVQTKSSCTQSPLLCPNKRLGATLFSGELKSQSFWVWGYQVELRAAVRYQTEGDL